MSNRRKIESEGVQYRQYAIPIRSAASDDGKMVIEGTAAVYNQYTRISWYLEVIKPGFFDEMDFTPAMCLKNHDDNYILGRWSNQTLSLTPSQKGLEFVSNLPDTTNARDAYTEIKDGFITECSFAFTLKKVSWSLVSRDLLKGLVDEKILDKVTYDGYVEVRELVQGDVLYDVAPVVYPAYSGTAVQTKAMSNLDEDAIRAERDQFLGIAEKPNTTDKRSLEYYRAATAAAVANCNRQRLLLGRA